MLERNLSGDLSAFENYIQKTKQNEIKKGISHN